MSNRTPATSLESYLLSHFEVRGRVINLILLVQVAAMQGVVASVY